MFKVYFCCENVLYLAQREKYFLCYIKKPQLLRTLFAFPEDLSSVPSIHICWLTTACNFSSGVLGCLIPLTCKDTYTCVHNYTMCTHIIKNNKS